MAELIQQLASADGVIRVEARKLLVGIGRPAVPLLTIALQGEQPHVSWEAAKALGEIGDDIAAPALVEAMKNADEDTSWVAAEALVHLGHASLIPVLKGLLKHAGFNRFRIGAHHVLSCSNAAEPNGGLKSVLDALDGSNPELAAPVAAEQSLLEFAPFS
jgi:HEAT repeat protein